MGEANRKADAIAQAKMVTGVSTDPARKLMLLAARGPLDTYDTVIAMPYAQLKMIAGQLVTQEGEAELMQLTGRAPGPSPVTGANLSKVE